MLLHPLGSAYLFKSHRSSFLAPVPWQGSHEQVHFSTSLFPTPSPPPHQCHVYFIALEYPASFPAPPTKMYTQESSFLSYLVYLIKQSTSLASSSLGRNVACVLVCTYLSDNSATDLILLPPIHFRLVMFDLV